MSIADLAAEIRREMFVEELLAAGYVPSSLDLPEEFDVGWFTEHHNHDGEDIVYVKLPDGVGATSDPPVYAVVFDPLTNSWSCSCGCGCQGPDPRAVFPHYFERINHVSG